MLLPLNRISRRFKKKKIRLQNEAKNTTIHMEMSFICIRIKQSFSYQWLIVHLASSWNWKDFLEPVSGLLNVGFPLEITSFFGGSLTIPPPSGIPNTSSREYRGSMEIFWKWYLCYNKILQEHLLDRLLDTCTWEWKIKKIYLNAVE